MIATDCLSFDGGAGGCISGSHIDIGNEKNFVDFLIIEIITKIDEKKYVAFIW